MTPFFLDRMILLVSVKSWLLAKLPAVSVFALVVVNKCQLHLGPRL